MKTVAAQTSQDLNAMSDPERKLPALADLVRDLHDHEHEGPAFYCTPACQMAGNEVGR